MSYATFEQMNTALTALARDVKAQGYEKKENLGKLAYRDEAEGVGVPTMQQIFDAEGRQEVESKSYIGVTLKRKDDSGDDVQTFTVSPNSLALNEGIGVPDEIDTDTWDYEEEGDPPLISYSNSLTSKEVSLDATTVSDNTQSYAGKATLKGGYISLVGHEVANADFEYENQNSLSIDIRKETPVVEMTDGVKSALRTALNISDGGASSLQDIFDNSETQEIRVDYAEQKFITDRVVTDDVEGLEFHDLTTNSITAGGQTLSKREHNSPTSYSEQKANHTTGITEHESTEYENDEVSSKHSGRFNSDMIEFADGEYVTQDVLFGLYPFRSVENDEEVLTMSDNVKSAFKTILGISSIEDYEAEISAIFA